MKYLKWFFTTIVVLLIAAVISTFFMSKDFRVSYSQIINASPDAVYNQIVTVKNWENWSYWKTLDDKMITTYNDIPSGVGSSYSWKSEKLGNGTLIIERTIVNEYIQSKLTFEGEGNGFSEYIIRKTPEGTELTSAMNSKTDGIIDKLKSRIFGKYFLNKAFKESATKLNAYLQSNPYKAPASDSILQKTTPDSIIANK